MILEIFALAIANAFYIIGFFEASKEGMLLYPITKAFRRDFLGVLYDPMFGCYKCMASIHGVFFSFCYALFVSKKMLLCWPFLIFYIPLVSGLSILIYELILCLRKLRDFINN